MTKYRTVYSDKALKQLSTLPKSLSDRIFAKVRFYRLTGDPLTYAKKLKSHRFGTYRFRVGDYRVIFDVDDDGMIKILVILSVGHRKNVY